MRSITLTMVLFSSVTSLGIAEDHQPAIIQRVLKKIETIEGALTLEDVFSHLGLNEEDLELEYGDTGMGAHDWVYAVTADKKWFLNVVWYWEAAKDRTLVSYVALYPGQDYEHQHVKSRRPNPLKPFYRYTVPEPKPEPQR